VRLGASRNTQGSRQVRKDVNAGRNASGPPQRSHGTVATSHIRAQCGNELHAATRGRQSSPVVEREVTRSGRCDIAQRTAILGTSYLCCRSGSSASAERIAWVATAPEEESVGEMRLIQPWAGFTSTRLRTPSRSASGCEPEWASPARLHRSDARRLTFLAGVAVRFSTGSAISGMPRGSRRCRLPTPHGYSRDSRFGRSRRRVVATGLRGCSTHAKTSRI
jgi:hypothetical protein